MRGMTLMVLLGLVATAAGQEPAKPKSDEPKDAKPTLKIGDAAPKITGAKYLAGTAVDAYDPKKVYVVEFWATWCGPCIQAMPHLAELNAEFKDKGLVVVGVTTKDPNNSAEKVEKFVETRGKKHGYTFAYCDGEATYDAFMVAAGQQGIPCSFVVDKAGKIAYIGHPSQLDDVLPKVLAGTWRGQADLDEIAKADEEFGEIMKSAQGDPAAAGKKLDAYAAKYPTRAGQEQFAIQKLVLALMAKDFDAGKAQTEALMKTAVAKKKGNTLGTLSAVWIAPQLNPGKKHPELIVAALDELIKLDGATDINAQLHAAEIYQMMEKKEAALKHATTALGMASNDDEKKYVEKLIEKIKGEKK